jgi:predicted acyl esterase
MRVARPSMRVASRAWPVVAIVMLAGCTTPSHQTPAQTQDDAAFPRCQDPWPCADGSEWPVGLVGPFAHGDPEHAVVPSLDGVPLDGWIWKPRLPAGIRAPVVLWTTPYLGTCSYQSVSGGNHLPSCTGWGGSKSRLDSQDNFGALIDQGYAVALFSVRGTGDSGGCFDAWGPKEQQDQNVLVDHLAGQAWSNGRVAMTGISYMGATPWEAAIQAPKGLKAILVGGIVTDVYLGVSSPQGAIRQRADVFEDGTGAFESLVPPVGQAEMLLPYAPIAKDRACPGTADVFTAYTLASRGDDRPETYFDDRRLSDGFANVTTAVLVAQGLQDNAFHAFQDDAIWDRLPRAPKWFVLGQWGHTLAFDGQLTDFPYAKSWGDLQRAWLDFWLKGLGQPPRTGVDYQDTGMAWHASASWPPAEGRDEVLYLQGDKLTATRGEGARRFTAAPLIGAETACPTALPVAASLAYTSDPVAQPVTLAGNPFVYLEVTSDQPGGTFSVDLLRFPKGVPCGDGEPELAASGAIDLRFHEGNFAARPFPTGTPTAVRIDLNNLALHLDAGDALAVVVRNPNDRDTREFNPTISVSGASQVVLPVVSGTLGGPSPTVDYPPRPF